MVVVVGGCGVVVTSCGEGMVAVYVSYRAVEFYFQKHFLGRGRMNGLCVEVDDLLAR